MMGQGFGDAVGDATTRWLIALFIVVLVAGIGFGVGIAWVAIR